MLYAQEGEAVAFDDCSQGFSGDGGQAGVSGDLVDVVEGFHGGADGAEGPAAAEEEFVHYAIVVGVVDDLIDSPGLVKDDADIGEDVLVLGQEEQSFIDPGPTHAADYDAEIFEGAGYLVEQGGAGLDEVGWAGPSLGVVKHYRCVEFDEFLV